MDAEVKKAKLDEEVADEMKAEMDELEDLGSFELSRVLQEDKPGKTIYLEGAFPSHSETDVAILILEKTAFAAKDLAKVLTKDTAVLMQSRSGIFDHYDCTLPENVNNSRMTLIYPASAQSISQYEACPSYLINESQSLYKSITEPNLEADGVKVQQWLEERKRKGDILLKDPAGSFALVAEEGWNRKRAEDMSLLVFPSVSYKLRTIRDLRRSHVPLLKDMCSAATKWINDTYQVPLAQVRCSIGYPPKFNRLHLQMTHTSLDAHWMKAELAHLLPKVIWNLEQQSDYYSKTLLPMSVRESSPIFRTYKKHGYHCSDDVIDVCKVNPEDGMLAFFQNLTKTKQCREADKEGSSRANKAFRRAVIAFFLSRELDRIRIMTVALSFGLVGLGISQGSAAMELSEKLDVLHRLTFQSLPVDSAAELYELSLASVDGTDQNTEDQGVYKKLCEFELSLEQWEMEGQTAVSWEALLEKMCEAKLTGHERYKLFTDQSELKHALNFLLQVFALCQKGRSIWSSVGPGLVEETIASYQYSIGIMALATSKSVSKTISTSPCFMSLFCNIIKDFFRPPAHDNDQPGIAPDLAKLVEALPGPYANDLHTAWQMLTNEQEGVNPDVDLVRDLEKMATVLQAQVYERLEEVHVSLQHCFDDTEGKYRTPLIKQLAWLLTKERTKRRP